MYRLSKLGVIGVKEMKIFTLNIFYMIMPKKLSWPPRSVMIDFQNPKYYLHSIWRMVRCNIIYFGRWESDFKITFFYRTALDDSEGSRPEMFLGKGVLKICHKFTRKHPYRSAISKKLQSDFIKVTLQHRCSLVNLLNIFRTSFYKNNYEGLLLQRNQFISDWFQGYWRYHHCKILRLNQVLLLCIRRYFGNKTGNRHQSESIARRCSALSLKIS